ncbi:MAG: BamA/TamA family outer membrane protein [Ascidiaceihabitans sp.]|nr:BamA/TamA family outer membrane protein [Ascidiaceihabitans sp.]
MKLAVGGFAAALGAVSVAPNMTSAANLQWEGRAPDTDLSAALDAVSLLNALPQDASAQDVLVAAQADYARLISAFYSAGFFGPTISITIDGREAASIPPVSPPSIVSQVVIRTTSGPQFVFGKAEIAPLAARTEMPAGFAKGAPAGTDILRGAVTTSVDAWRNAGHAKAQPVAQDISADHPNAQLNASVTLDPGPRLTFGDLLLDSKSTVSDERIAEIAGLPTGSVYSPQELRRVTTRLRRTGTFGTVSLTESDTIGPNDTLDITAKITDQTPRRFGFGAEISSLEGLGVSAYWMHWNFLGGAERLRIEGEIEGIGGESGGTDFRLSARFDRPATFNEDTNFYAVAEIERQDEVLYELDTASIEIGIKRFATEKREYTFGIGIETAHSVDAFGTRDYTIFTLPVGVQFDYRDDTLDAKKGYYANISATPFLSIEGAGNGLRTYADLRAFYTIETARPLTFALRGQLGSVAGVSQALAPTDFLFYSGGGGTVRGRSYQSLSVDLGGGNLVGGRSFIGLSSELRLEATDTIGLVGFYDIGYIGSESFPNGTDGDWHCGAGVGLRYATGIGPIRLDVAVPVSGPDTSSDLQIYIGIGQSF